VSKFGNGEAIPEAKTTLEWEQLSMSNQPVFMKKLVNGTEYYFYNWYAVSDIRKLTNENFIIPDQYHFQIINAYSKFQITPIGIISEQGAFTKVSEQQYYWTSSEYNEKGKRESAVSVSISKTNTGETELKQAYKQEGFLVLVIESEKLKAITNSVALSVINNNKNLSSISTQPITIEKQNVTSNNPVVINSSSKPNKPFSSVTIGNQIWMTENLNVDRFRNGDLITEAKTVKEWVQAGENKQPAWCYYENNSTIGAKYGKLYNWFAISDPRGLAPDGWSIPSFNDWTQLSLSLGGDEKAGNKLKSSMILDGGFFALMGGERSLNGTFIELTETASFWTSSSNNNNFSWKFNLSSKLNYLYKSTSFNELGLSVRCIKNL
jgi:uncharacterized protein (TIGR02145 family)